METQRRKKCFREVRLQEEIIPITHIKNISDFFRLGGACGVATSSNAGVLAEIAWKRLQRAGKKKEAIR
jgi:hypothetical protein